MKFKAFMKDQLESLNPYMEDFIQPTKNDVEEAMLYSVQSGGKRIRPLIILAFVQAFGEDPKKAYDPAAAIEWIHTYSLIHDDLPAIDNDDLRRGQASNHKVYGEAIAILAGDGLLTQAFEIIGQSADLTDQQKVFLSAQLASFAGSRGMIDGQIQDIQAENKEISLEQLQSIHHAKTGALIRFSSLAGGVCAGQDEQVLHHLDQFGQHIGLAFQIRDDILDVVGDVESIGKQPGQDQRLEKSTYPSLLGLDSSYEALDQALDQTIEEIETIQDLKNQNQQDFDSELICSFVDELRLEKNHG